MGDPRGVAGLSATGFLALRLDDVRAEIEAEWRTRFGANADLSADSPDGQIVGILAEREAALWEQLAGVYAAGYIDSARGAALDEIAALAGITRLQESASAVTLIATGTAGTVLPAGRTVRLIDTETIWGLAAATIGAGGTVSVLATAQEVGPKPALSGPTTAWAIVTPVSGWVSVSNALDARVGRITESDEGLRQRVRRGYTQVGETPDGIRSAVSRVTDVEEVIVRDNVYHFVDADGRPPNSFEVVVRGGDNDQIAQAIWSAMGDGIQSFGNGADSGTATTLLGTTESVAFTRPIEIPVWISMSMSIDTALFPLDALTGEPDVARVAAEVLAYEDTLTIGKDVVPFAILQNVETPGIVTVTLRLGRSASPSGIVPLQISGREIAALDSSRITVEIV